MPFFFASIFIINKSGYYIDGLFGSRPAEYGIFNRIILVTHAVGYRAQYCKRNFIYIAHLTDTSALHFTCDCAEFFIECTSFVIAAYELVACCGLAYYIVFFAGYVFYCLYFLQYPCLLFYREKIQVS